MKQLFTILLLTTFSAIIAQNWSPVLVNEKMNYQSSSADYISNTIWVDSTSVTGNDSVFYFNRIVTDHPTNSEMVLRNQPQFLLKQMTKLNDGIYLFSDPGSFIIQSFANVGDTWTFDPANEIEAEVTETLVEEIFGILDSVKIISLSNGIEFRLSKSFGIVQFPKFNGYGSYELVGIQNTEYGESVPDFWDIFDFEVGDVFQYYENFSWWTWYYETTTKIQINSKEIFIDSIVYNVKKIMRKLEYGQISIYTSYNDLVFHYNENLNMNKFQNEIIQLGNYYCDINYNGTEYYSRIRVNIDSIGVATKCWGNDLYLVSDELFYNTDPPSNELRRLINEECFAEYPYGIAWSNGLGLTLEYFNDNFEFINYTMLVGYIKDNDTVGIISSDSLLLVGVNSTNYYEKSTFTIFPNPANEIITIKNLNPIEDKSFDIEIRNLQGILVIEEKNINSEEFVVDVGELPAGLYLYLIREKNEIIQQGKLIIK